MKSQQIIVPRDSKHVFFSESIGWGINQEDGYIT